MDTTLLSDTSAGPQNSAALRAVNASADKGSLTQKSSARR
jgi:hypothetical protein